ncbi:hypothetical protein BN439_2153 [Erwinia amylovora Ea644]|uniref:DUF1345 domain-containing protein n=1 Tax=Erwinia amylovora TaxID=552 RepID=UPI0002CA01C2|nr:DUF1345 domain-containing protein [Erwinia amylovora]CCP03209.1 hypothetical protein BN439_2153 [Erwinia amylovora Ea644]CCP07212.1 hypothetical protein BN440_2189 [Erwinia amylovora MR1]
MTFWPPLRHLYQSRPRLLVAFLLSVVSFFLIPASQSLAQRLLIGWNVLAWLYLLSLWWLMLRTPAKDIARIARVQDESAGTVLALVCVACLVSILAILFELGEVKHLKDAAQVRHIVLTVTTLVVSWSLLPTAFAMHYAHMFYLSKTESHKALLFPDKLHDPGYWDFIYYSFTLAVASQTADVATGNTTIRQVTTLQAVLSFIFNLAILGLSINVGAGLLN